MIFGIETSYAIALGVFIISWAVFWGIQKLVVNRLTKLADKTENDFDDALVCILETIHPLVLGAAALALAVRFTTLPTIAVQVVSAIFLVAIVYQVSVGVSKAIDLAILKKRGKKISGDQQSAMTLLSTSVKWIIWLVGALLILSNLGINITSLIAGLGIGGIAIAFALQNILSDLFSSFAIYFDKPFEVGDFIMVGSITGTVEKIGIKTTRLRALQGEQVVIPNKTLTSENIQNFKKLQRRRAVLNPGVLYETPSKLVKEIPDIAKKIVEKEDMAEFDRAHFKAFGDSALVYEIVYYVLSDQYADFMDVNQRIQFALKEEFEKKGIEFAYPTQTLYVKK